MADTSSDPGTRVMLPTTESERVVELRFADVVVELRAGMVRRGGAPLMLRPKAYDVLVYFARRPGALVSRSDVLDAIWPDVTVTDDSLVQCLVEIRRALGDAAPITTVRGRGYRFDAAVEVIAVDPRLPPVGQDTSKAPAASWSGSAPVSPKPRYRDWRIWAGTTALIGCGLAAWLVSAGWSTRALPRDVGRPLGGESLNREAIRLHDEGRTLYGRQTRVTTLQAVERFDAATRLDPEYAGAWSGLAHALTRLHIYGSAASPTVLPRAKAAATRAIALDPTLADAHSAMAHLLEQYDRDWAGAEASHRRAIALDPNDARLRQVYALFLVSRLRTADALAEVEHARALAVDPARTMALRGLVLMFAGQSLEALASFDEARRLQTSNSLAEYFRAFVLADLGRLDEALMAANSARTEAGNEPTVAVGVVHALAGRRTEALEVRQALVQKSASAYVPPTDFAMLAVALGEHDEAVRWLERGADERSRGMAAINVHPVLRRLRGHPGYLALVRRLDLPLPQ